MLKIPLYGRTRTDVAVTIGATGRLGICAVGLCAVFCAEVPISARSFDLRSFRFRSLLSVALDSRKTEHSRRRGRGRDKRTVGFGLVSVMKSISSYGLESGKKKDGSPLFPFIAAVLHSLFDVRSSVAPASSDFEFF